MHSELFPTLYLFGTFFYVKLLAEHILAHPHCWDDFLWQCPVSVTVTRVLWGSWGKLRALLAGSATRRCTSTWQISQIQLSLYLGTLQCLPFLHRQNPGVTQLPNRRRQVLFQQQMFAQGSVPGPQQARLLSQGICVPGDPWGGHCRITGMLQAPVCQGLFFQAPNWPICNFHVCFALNTPQKYLKSLWKVSMQIALRNQQLLLHVSLGYCNKGSSKSL